MLNSIHAVTSDGARDNGMPAVALGAVCIVTAVIMNEWTVARLLSVEGRLAPQALRTWVWAFQVVAAGAGFVIARHRMRLRRAYLLALPIPVLAVLAVAEGGTRSFLNQARSPMRIISPDLGWKTAENVRLSFVHPAFGPVQFSTGRHGFRRFGDTASPRKTVLFIGDSFTEASHVSDGLAYYDLIAKESPEFEVFAYGTGGYGTLQEYMILDRYVDLVRPDLIVWQFDANDFINNDHFLEIRSPFSSRMTRPYYENGRIEYHFAGSGLLSRYSRLVRFVDARVATLRGHGFQTMDLAPERKNFPREFDRSIRTTSRIMRKVRERAGNIPIVAFASEADHFSDSVFRDLSKENGWEYVPGLMDSVAAGKTSGIVVDGLPRDGHWTSAGHAIAGRVIQRYLRTADLSLAGER